jgi:acyl-CoA dehydrogenase
MYKNIFNQVKRIIPKISETEIIALKSGGTSIDRYIFEGKMNYKELFSPIKKNVLSKQTEDRLNSLLKVIGQNNIYPNKNINTTMKELGIRGFLGMIIDERYGGNRMPVELQSQILSKISSYNPSLGVVTMVPNSLGPAELLQHYGTEEQKIYFLPKLSTGEFIPCFGLTGPNNGSDAVGEIDEGIVENINNKLKIKITLNKRYITLAPISNLIGIAFKLNDPNNLLGNGKSGITLALIENTQEGLLLETYHNPNNAGFPNGTIKGNIYIDPEQVIGGQDKIGEGWKMLMECLAVGRGVSLPATANGSSKFITQTIKYYINSRKQFNMCIGDMEAVKEKFIDMYINTWIIHTSVKLTNHILDNGKTPSVITAIMKQQTTERARKILNHGMDIYSGSGICTGENNFFTKFYNASPVGITVEGSNTLTRGLIIFGQGLNKSHPYIFPIFETIQENNIDEFKNHFNGLIQNISSNYMRVINPMYIMGKNDSQKRLELLTSKFSILSNFVALLGGKIKQKQMISGNMADILSNIYLGYSLLWYHHHFNGDIILRDACMKHLLQEVEYKMNVIISNYPITILKPFIYPIKNNIEYENLEDKNRLYTHILFNNNLNEILNNDIYYDGTVMEKLIQLSKLNKSSKDYKLLYEDIIKVGEYKINDQSE